VRRGLNATAVTVALLLGAASGLPAAAAEGDRVDYGDAAGFTAAMSAVDLDCKTAGADTSCTYRGSDGGIMAVTMNGLGMFSVVFAGRALESPSVAEGYRAAANRLPFGDGSLLDRFADPAEIVSFCRDAGYVGAGDDVKWCDATVVYSADGATVVQNVTQEVLEALGAEGIDRATVNAAVDQTMLHQGIFVAVQDSATAPTMSAIAWLPTERFATDAQ